MKGKSSYKFEASVTFKPLSSATPGQGEDKVPAALGGGA
jgi:hypothetical protein